MSQSVGFHQSAASRITTNQQPPPALAPFWTEQKQGTQHLLLTWREKTTLTNANKNKYKSQGHNTLRNAMNPIVAFRLEIWSAVGRKYKLKRDLCTLRWFEYDSKCKPGMYDPVFKEWVQKGATAICTVSEGEEFLSFRNLKTKYSLEIKDFYRYMQLRVGLHNIGKKTDIAIFFNPTIYIAMSKNTGILNSTLCYAALLLSYG